MTIRRQWLLMLTLTAVLAILINSLVLGSLINRYFQVYTTGEYTKNLAQVQNFSTMALTQKNLTGRQIEVQLESYLNDPITRIALYGADGSVLANTGAAGGMADMMGGMMQGMTGPFSQKVESIAIASSGRTVGTLQVTHFSSIGDSLTSVRFRAALVRNSLFSFGIVLLLLTGIGLYASRRLSRDLANTSTMALGIDLGGKKDIPLSKVREIRIIQQSLTELEARLKLKQMGRKRLIDELVHQTRTPLTILKTHLEGFQDGVLEATPEAMQTCETQIDNISSIIGSMRGLLDTEQEESLPNVEEFEFGRLIRQILAGLKLQFDQKQVALSLKGPQKLVMKTDRYKLSQCIYNVLTNAYKFTGPGGKVAVGFRAEGGVLSVAIEDTGTGIPAEDQKHLFDAYYRGGNARNVSGEGLGLFFVRQNLAQIKGTIRVESSPGKGSRFLLQVPLA